MTNSANRIHRRKPVDIEILAAEQEIRAIAEFMGLLEEGLVEKPADAIHDKSYLQIVFDSMRRCNPDVRNIALFKSGDTCRIVLLFESRSAECFCPRRTLKAMVETIFRYSAV